jgi:hypothetical protein
MKWPKYFFDAFFAVTLIFLVAARPASAWEASGRIPGTEIDYAELKVSKEGVSVRLSNTSHTDVKLSLALYFYDRSGNDIGHSIFALMEIPGGGYADFAGNYLTGRMRDCRDAPRIEWKKMTYEYLY